MTVIAWDGHTLAADKLADYGGMNCTVTKIFLVHDYKVGKDFLVGVAGELSFGLQMIEWIKAGRDPLSFPVAQTSKDDWQPVCVIEPDSAFTLIYERTPFPIQYEHRAFAIGSGREFARAALYLGKTAVEAVGVANALCISCGNGIDTLTFKP